jgi:type IV pilus assembly protein PilF
MPTITRARRWCGVAALAVLLDLSACVTTRPPDALAKADLHEASDINTRLGVSYLQQGDLRLAQERLKSALEQNPNNPSAHEAIALLYTRRGDYGEAEKEYRRTLELDQGNPDRKNSVGSFLCDRGKNDEGLRYLLEAAQNRDYSSPEMAWSNAGVCAYGAKRPDDAEKYLREALRVNPNYAPALAQLAHISFERKEFLYARGFLQRYERVGPPTPDTLWLGAVVERQLGNPRDAHDYEVKLIQKFPNSDQSRQMLSGTSP